MTISTSYLFDRALGQMTDLQTRISKAQDQLATGKRSEEHTSELQSH